MFEKLSLNRKEKSAASKRIGFFIKLLLTALMLWFVFRRLDPAAIKSSVESLPIVLIIGIILISVLRHYIQYLNWFCALKMNHGVKFKRKEVMASYLVAQPLRFAIPGGSASFAKIFYLENTSVFASFIATSTERLFLTWATWSFAAIAYLCLFTTHSLILRLGLVVLLVFIPLWTAFILAAIPKTKKYLSGYLIQAPMMMLLQIANTSLMYLQYYLLLNRFVRIDAIETWLGMSLTNISNSIPITISGLGLREGFAMHFLADYGFNAEQAVAVTLSLFVFHDVIFALIGAGVLIASPAKQKKLRKD
ncbi:MAG: hypothetical protein GX106_00210 [Candidatus Cloacimonetes bacterium]|nr:hypothetical protein [Candidatus Cloacimonadota bacterium]